MEWESGKGKRADAGGKTASPPGAFPLLYGAPALPVPRSGKTLVAGGGAQQPPESRSCVPCRVAALQSPDWARSSRRYAAFVGFCSRPGVFAALHRLFVSRRSAAVCRTTRAALSDDAPHGPFIDAQKRGTHPSQAPCFARARAEARILRTRPPCASSWSFDHVCMACVTATRECGRLGIARGQAGAGGSGGSASVRSGVVYMAWPRIDALPLRAVATTPLLVSLTLNRELRIESGNPLRLRYGLWMHGGVPRQESSEKHWQLFAESKLPSMSQRTMIAGLRKG